MKLRNNETYPARPRFILLNYMSRWEFVIDFLGKWINWWLFKTKHKYLALDLKISSKFIMKFIRLKTNVEKFIKLRLHIFLIIIIVLNVYTSQKITHKIYTCMSINVSGSCKTILSIVEIKTIWYEKVREWMYISKFSGIKA